MDTDIAGWILEFLLRQPIEDNIIETLLNILPLTNNDYRLIKCLLLRTVSSDISNGLVTEKTLESLELIEEYDYTHGVGVLDSMREAYCAVAVHCTVMCLKEKPDDFRTYFDAVIRIWRGRIHDLEKCEKVGLVTDRLKETRNEIEEALWNESVRNIVLTRDTLGDAVKLLKVFLADASKEIGPSFLEVAVKAMNDKEREVCIPPNILVADQVGARRACSFDVPQDDFHFSNEGNLGHNANEVALDSAKEVPPAANDKYIVIGTPEVRRVQEALKSSTLALQAVVKDPLPEALNMAATISASMTREEIKIQNVVHIDEGVKAAADANEASTRNQTVASRPSLMSRNGTARTFEWDEDSIDSSHEGSPNRPHLPTPRKRVVSPLVKQEIGKVSRRKVKKWSSLEEQTLRDAVKEYGRGNWKLILDRYREAFDERTVVDLKDKWRNMTK